MSTDTSLSTFLGQGIGPLLASRLAGLGSALTIFATMPLLFFLAPFVVIGAWLRRRDAALQPWLVYGVTLFAFSALLFAVHVPYGTFLHSAVALVPHAYVAALVGIAGAVDWVAARRPSWNPPRARRVFTAMVVGVVALGSVGGGWITLRAWRHEMDQRAPIVAALAQAPAGDRVMSPDAGAYRYLTGHPGVVTPDDPLPVIEDALRRYGVRWLVLETAHLVPALGPVLSGEVRPTWLSAPIVTADAQGRPVTGADPASPSPAAALYAVCLEPGDARCTP